MEHILLVEDEATSRRILAAYLGRAGFKVDEAEDGQEAWEKLAVKQDYAVIVTDRNMPNMDGLTLAKRVHADDTLRHIPVIMQTGADSPQEVVEGIQAGVYYYLVKPYEETALMALVRTAVQDRRKYEWTTAKLVRQNDALGKFVRGEFHIQTPEEAQNVAYLLGSLFPRPDAAVSGLYELLLNAIEHGNLGIGFEKKAQLLAASGWEEEIARRLSGSEHASKKVDVRFTQHADHLEVIISDEGRGFDWTPYLEIEPSRATRSNGRGIAKANLLSFDALTYKGNGNQVQVIARFAA